MSESPDHKTAALGWVEFQLGGPLPALEIFAEFMNDQGAGGSIFSEDPAQPDAHMVTAFLSLSRADSATVAGIRKRVEELSREFPGIWSPLKITAVADQDWAEGWKKNLKPERLDPGIWIVPSFMAAPPEAANEPVIILDPGMAFGTGAHVTTRSCLKLVAEAVAQGARSVLDLGAGTGILAMTAARFGAETILAMDIDQIALRVARENIAQNGLKDKIELRTGVADPQTSLGRLFDLIAANLFAEMLVKLMPFMSRHLKPAGKAALSGILSDRAAAVESAAASSGLAIINRIEEQEWVTMLLARGAGAS
jgi:ribosomal protein L11 methyltransferase